MSTAIQRRGRPGLATLIEKFPLILFLALLVWLSVQSPYFLSWQNISLMLVQSVPLAILCFGLVCVIAVGGDDVVSGGIDLSLPATAVLGVALLSLGLAEWHTPYLLLLALLAAWLVTERTLWGKYVRAIGQNSEAARIAGIRDRLTMLGVLVAASALCAVGGVILSANLRQFTPLAGQSYLMDAIAAVFIGTAFTRLGRVSTLGTLGGVLFLAIIDNGLNLMGLNYLVKDALVGVILVVALALSFWQARLRQTHR
ncbi:TPA: ABC transporter permease [Klebsiella pneumoniae]